MKCRINLFGHLLRSVVVSVLLATITAHAQQPSRSRQFPPGSVRQTEDLPPGRFRSEIERLPATARDRALEWLRDFHFTELDLESLHADGQGAIYYADEFSLTDPPANSAVDPPIAEAAVPISPFPANLVFHSKPGSPNVLYLNFCGENVTGTAWNSTVGKDPIPAVAFSTDADFSTFSDAEQLAIKRVWQRVAEDYAPFDVDVTTERPVTFTTRTAHALITRNTDAVGGSNPSSGAGGVAYVNVFGSGGYSTYRPGWIYFNNLANTEHYIAEAVSHEMGHNFGLSHDAKTDGSSYYGGHGSGDTSWGPIMGTGYNRNVSQWSKGEYYLANNTEDDLVIISGKAPYRADDHGNTPASATPLVLTTGTNIVSTTPETDPANSNPDNKGILERNTDVDVFSFVTGNGPISLSVNPWTSPSGTRGGNLDVVLELRSQTGALLLANNDPNLTGAIIQTNLPEGLYYLYVRNTGAGDPFSSTPTGYTVYASIGQYFISGFLTSSSYAPPPSAQLQVSNVTQPGVGANHFTVTYTGSTAIDVSTVDGQDTWITGPNGYSRAGQFISVDVLTDGSPRVATYAAAPPAGGVWTAFDNGTYTISMRSNQVSNISGAAVIPSQLGQFTVSIPTIIATFSMDSNPGWTLEPLWQYGPPAYLSGGPTSGFTSSSIIGYNLSGYYENNLTTKYATTPVINCSGFSNITLQFARWLRLKNNDTATIQVSINGSSWTDVWSASQPISDNAWQPVQYSLPSWTAGSPTVQLRWGMGSGPSQNDIGWNLDDVQLLGNSTGTNPMVQLTATVNNPAWGTVNPTSGTYVSGSSVQVMASPATYFRFLQWTNGASGTNDPITLILNTNVSIQATFGERLTTNYPTPYWWLASFGYTNFESSVTSIGSNGVPLWQSYVAGLNPNSPTSQFRILITRQPDKTNYVLNWNTSTGRVYTIWQKTNLAGKFVAVPGASNLPYSTQKFTNSFNPSVPVLFYRVEVRKP